MLKQPAFATLLKLERDLGVNHTGTPLNQSSLLKLSYSDGEMLAAGGRWCQFFPLL